jgi:hypothetical protein
LRALSLQELLEHRRVALVDLVLPLRALGQRADVAHFLGIATACGIRSPSISRSTRPQAKASFAPIGLPVAHISSAFRTPATRGRRCVPAGAGQQAELHFGRAELGRRHRHPIMAGERDFEPAAERGAVDRGDHRLRAIFDRVDHHRQPRLLRRLAELGYVGPGEEGLALAGYDQRRDAVVGLRLLDRRD